ncbi:MAG TPA: radical SAM protein [bacterium]|nr:radical SAM protein [bacterium]
MKNVLLIWPPNELPNMNFVPIGLGYIAANTSAKYSVKIKDFALDEYAENDFVKLLNEINPIAIGISFWEFNFQNVKIIAGKIKAINKKYVIILGGPSASARKNSGLQEIQADFAIKGEGEKSFEALLDLIDSGKSADTEMLARIPGLTHFDNNKKSFLSIPIQPLELSEIKWPDYEKIRVSDYLKNGYDYGYFSKKLINYPIIITRGCPFKCQFCSARQIHGSKIRKRTIESALDEIKYLYYTFSVRAINIVDDNFTFDRAFVTEFCKAAIAAKSEMPDLVFASPNGVCMKTLNDELIDLMKEAGWESLTIAPESGSEKTLKAMNKQANFEEIKYYSCLIKKHKMKLFGFFIIGYPEETIEDIKKTIDFACSLPIDLITFSPFTPLHGTPVYDKLVASGELSQEYISSNYFDITYSPRGISLRKMIYLHRLALYKSLFLSPARLLFLIKSYSLKRILNYANNYFKKNTVKRKTLK